MANLSTPTGSLMNNIAIHSRQSVPVVGMGATQLCYTDRHAATVVEVFSASRIAVTMDTAKRIDTNGMSESQDYAYTSNLDGARTIVTLRKNGRWVTVGESQKNGQCWAIGHRDSYHDYSF